WHRCSAVPNASPPEARPTATRCNIPTPRLSHLIGVDFRRLTGAPLRMHDPIIIPTDEGLFCPAGNFHIDPLRPVAAAVITHAPAEHARSGIEHYLALHDSLPIMRHRLGEHRFTGLDYGARRSFGAVTISLHPAGHVLGSAQVRVEHDDGRVWVVTGDYK